MIKLILSFFMILNMLFLMPSKTENKNDEFDNSILDADFIDIETRKQKVGESYKSTDTYLSNISHYSNFKNHYFDNLTYNFGVNYKGSCGYVAMAMLLSYYDTYISDDIVDEQYDIVSSGYEKNMIDRRNSPGTLKDLAYIDASPDSGFSLNANDYYSFVNSMKDVSLHSKLIMIGASKGYFDFSDDENPVGTNFDSRKNVISSYLDSRNISYELECCDRGNSKLIRDFTIRKIKLGIPVLLAIRNNRGGHAVVAYDYDESRDELYCHMGWNAKTTHVTPESQGFTTYYTALTINFEIKHKHSNNYCVTSLNNGVPHVESYCYDSSEIYTFHPHSYNEHYENIGSNNPKHRAYCKCGEFIEQNHSYNGVWVSGGKVMGVCTKCQTTCIIRNLSLSEIQLYNMNLLNFNLLVI